MKLWDSLEMNKKGFQLDAASYLPSPSESNRSEIFELEWGVI